MFVRLVDPQSDDWLVGWFNAWLSSTKISKRNVELSSWSDGWSNKPLVGCLVGKLLFGYCYLFSSVCKFLAGSKLRR
jgi:hypothetical protein